MIMGEFVLDVYGISKMIRGIGVGEAFHLSCS
jgi:hypothetical protein